MIRELEIIAILLKEGLEVNVVKSVHSVHDLLTAHLCTSSSYSHVSISKCKRSQFPSFMITAEEFYPNRLNFIVYYNGVVYRHNALHLEIGIIFPQ